MVKNYSYYDNLSAKDVFDLALKGDGQALEYIGSLLAYSSDLQKCIKLTEEFWNSIRFSQYTKHSAGFKDISAVFCNEKNVFGYTEQGAKDGILECVYGLSCIYMNGFYGVTPNDEKVFYYAKKAGESGHPTGLAITGMCYYLGKGVPRDDDSAAYYLNEAVDLGQTTLISGEENVFYFLLPYYYNKKDGLIVKYAEYAIKDGNPEGYYYAGYAYLNGAGVEEDITKATSYFFEGIKKFPDDPKQQLRFGLAECLLIGFYGKNAFRDQFEDIEEIVNNLVDDMTDANDYKAFMLKGIFYQEGAFGYAKDDKKALQCFRTAKAHGIDDADTYIDELKNVVTDDGAEDVRLGSDSARRRTASKNSGKTEYEIIYEKKKKKRLLTAAIICVGASLLLRALLVCCSRMVVPLPWERYYEEEITFSARIMIALKSSVFQFSYFNAIILLSVILIRRGKKAAVIGIFAAIGLLLCDLFVLGPLCVRYGNWFYYSRPKITFGFPNEYYYRHGYWAENLTFTILSAVVSLVIYFITMNNIKTQTVWWYLIAVYWSIALLGIALIVAVAVFGVLVTAFGNSSPSYSMLSSSNNDSSDGWFGNASEEPLEIESIEKQAKHIAYTPGKYALFKQSIGWVVMDYYERITQVYEVTTGDLYNTYFKTSAGERYYVPTSSVSDDQIYEAYKTE